MKLDEYLSKWIKTQKNLYGVAGFIVIMIILAMNFSYWAGAIKINDSENGDKVLEDDDIMQLPEDYDSGVISDSLAHGRHLVAFQQIIGDPRGEGEGQTYNLYPVPILTNITKLEIVTDGDGGGSRIDGGDRNDIDIYLYAPEKEAGGDFESTDPDYEGATPTIKESISIKRDSLDFGNWTLRVDCYTGTNVAYTVQVQVFYGRENKTEEGD
jgi:hypothetical protein